REIAVLRRSWPEDMLLVGFERERLRHIRFGAHRDRVDAETLRGPVDPARDLAAIGDQELRKRCSHDTHTRPKILRASSTVAGSRPTSRAIRAALATRSPFDFAICPGAS